MISAVTWAALFSRQVSLGMKPWAGGFVLLKVTWLNSANRGLCMVSKGREERQNSRDRKERAPEQLLQFYCRNLG